MWIKDGKFPAQNKTAKNWWNLWSNKFLIQSIEISITNKYLTMKSDQIIDFWEARKRPLSLTPLSLCFPDGTVGITDNSTITKLISQIQIFEADAYVSVGAYFVDLMAPIWAARNLWPAEELIKLILSTIKRNCWQIYLTAISYRSIS